MNPSSNITPRIPPANSGKRLDGGRVFGGFAVAARFTSSQPRVFAESTSVVFIDAHTVESGTQTAG
jgi:hypothetical protein